MSFTAGQLEALLRQEILGLKDGELCTNMLDRIVHAFMFFAS
jgi:hypothetical protein